MSTFVSSTNSFFNRGFRGLRDFFDMASGAEDSWTSNCSTSEGFSKAQYLLYVAGNLDAAPFARQLAFAIDHEGAALDAADLFAVHVFHLHDAELRADRLVRVRQQL